jgi:hypothetical protein
MSAAQAETETGEQQANEAQREQEELRVEGGEGSESGAEELGDDDNEPGSSEMLTSEAGPTGSERRVGGKEFVLYEKHLLPLATLAAVRSGAQLQLRDGLGV